ncbi:type II secretion system protein [Krasilnikovia sp. MM14-A1004]|uniref:type II secretion system protein n=1 Tax=Krasilnikovia sp. MM14-A1004 TaxID=3373541 RepID=UPI00399C9A98
MRDTINRLSAHKGDEGFTLIELLVVVVIIGVLVAIAVPVYLNYRQGAADKSAQSDVRGAISTIEQWYTDNSNTYPSTPTGAQNGSFNLGTGTGTVGKITLSDKTTMVYKSVSTSAYKVCATNTGGSGKYYVYDSSAGGSVKADSTINSGNFATCG